MSGSNELPAPVALVTGATSGIGREVARKLAADGFSVLVHGRDPARGAAVVDEIIAAGGHARFAQADLTDAADIERLATEAADVDVLVNNAGFSWFGPTADLAPATFDAMFAANVRSAYFLVAAIASYAGGPENPQWYHNLLAHPYATVQDGPQIRRVRAREVFDEEKRTWWAIADALNPNYARYRSTAGRDIPILALEPADWADEVG